MQNTQALQLEIERHEGYLRSDSGNVPLRLKLGDLYHRAGRLDEALACYEEALRQAPADAPARSRLASVMITQHRFAEAEKALRALVAEGEQDPALHHNLGLALYFQARWDEARQCFAEAANRGLKLASNFAYWTRALHHLGSTTEAMEACNRWMELAQDGASRGYLALLRVDDGDMEGARQLAHEVLAQDPQNVDANVVAGVSCAERQEIEQARAHFETALRQEKDNGRAWLGLGLVHLYNQNHKEAVAALENAVRIHSDNSGMIVALGWARISSQDAAGAEQTFEQALRVDRNFGESHGGLAAALALQRKLDRAREEIKLARRLAPKGFGAEFAETAVLAVQGRQQDASEVFARALKATPREGVLPLIEQLRIYSSKRTRPSGAKARKTGRLRKS